MLQVKNLVKTFDADSSRRRKSGPDAPSRVRAVDDVTFNVEESELFTLLGPSGCGKTTTLRLIAGLEVGDAGAITLMNRTLFSRGNGRNVNVPANKRGLGMVFQSYAIWPHMRVFENVAFPLLVAPRSERVSKKEIRERVMNVLSIMELEHLEDRRATKLSGGQQQRLALARAVVTEPPVLLLDEPLSNLDAQLRESLRFELKRLQSELGITTIYVTHDQIEALALSSRIAVMRDGKIIQIGSPIDIYERPSDRFVAEFIGTSNLLKGTVETWESGEAVVETPSGMLVSKHSQELGKGDTVIVSIRPETIGITRTRPSDDRLNTLTGSAVTTSYMGDSVVHLMKVGDSELRVRVNPTQARLEDGDHFLTVEPEAVTLLSLT
jgi:iron(III) transport system ATP-binding protein